MLSARFSRVVACERLEDRRLFAGDAVVEWNNIALAALPEQTQYGGPGWASRGLAMMQIAVFDAVDAIKGGYQPYLYYGTAPADASVDAAVAAAAQSVLTTVFPNYAPEVAAAYQQSLSVIPASASRDEGVAAGLAAADAIIQARANDGSSIVTPYSYGSNPGDYQATPPDYSAPWGPGWGNVTPFGLESGSQFLPDAPPALDSAEYAKAFNQVKALGAADSSVRTADQTQIANFWSYDAQSYGTPIALYNQMMQTIAQQQGNTLEENARLFALTNIAMADAGIVVWKAKYDYNLWRPVTAIQQADTDGNPCTQADADWLPLGFEANGISNRTPAFPSYSSGHSAFGAAMFRTLAGFYGTDSIAFDATSDQTPGVVRHYDSFSQAAAENGISRIYLGVHYSFDNTASLIAGTSIGGYDEAKLLLPAGSNGDETKVDFPVVGDDNGGDGGHGGYRDHHRSGHDHDNKGLFSDRPILDCAY